MNFLLLFGWVAIVHRKFIPGINASWYRGLAARIAALTPVGLLLSFADLTSCSRIGLFFVLSGAWLAMAALTIADYSTKGSPPGRAAGPQLRQQHGY
jgi:hypothetical protein